MTTEVVWTLSTFPVEMALIFVNMIILPMRHGWLFALLRTACLFVGMAQILMGVVLWKFVVGLFSYVVLPCLFYSAPLAKRIMAVGLALLLMFACELAACASWALTTGEPIMSYEALDRHVPAAVLTKVLDIVLLVVGGSALGMLMRGKVGGAFGRTAWRLMPYPMLQFTFFAVFFALMSLGDFPMADAPEYLMGMFALLSAALLVDVALFASIKRHGQALEQDQRAAVLAERLDACLAEYAGAVAQVERAAALRHDLRNHLQVVGALLERGELARAAGYVREAEKEVRG